MTEYNYETMSLQELRDLRDEMLAVLKQETGLVLLGHLLPPELNEAIEKILRKSK